MPPDDTDGLEEADLPGLDDESPSPEPDVPTEPTGTEEPDSSGPREGDLSVFEPVARAVYQQPENALFAAIRRSFVETTLGRLFPPLRKRRRIPYAPPEPDRPSRNPESDVDDLQYVVLGDVDYERRHRKEDDGDPRDDIDDLQPVILGGEDLSGDISEGAPESDPGRVSPLRWIWVGGFGVIGLVLLGLFFFGGSDDAVDEEAVSLPSVAPVAEVTTPPSTEPVVADTAAPAAAVDAPEPSVVAVVADPADYVTITDWTVLADANGDGWIVATPAAPWLPGPDADTAFGLIFGIGIDLGYQTNTSWWTLYDGETRGESSIVGDDVRAALGGEVWVTPDGDLAVKLPGASPTEGLPVTDLGPDAAIYLYGQLWPEEGSEAQNWEETRPLGPVTQVTDQLPLPDWLREQLDFYEPITLIVPAG